MRVLVTGPTGYIGGRLTRRLLDEGHTLEAPLLQSVDGAANDAWNDFDYLPRTTDLRRERRLG